jgi:hypothetical protein
MALFSRRSKSSAEPSVEPVVQPSAEPDAAAPSADESAAPEPAQEAAAPEPPQESSTPETPAAETAPQVGISVSSFAGLGATPAPAAPAAAPAAPEVESGIPGMTDNVLLRDAIAALPEEADGTQVVGVARQLLQGDLFLRVRGDARALLAEGKELPLAVASIEDSPFVLVFSGGAALQAAVRLDGEVESTAMSQAAQVVLRSVVSGPYGGIILDHASRQSPIVLPRELIERALDEGDDDFAVKTLLAAERTPETAGQIVAVLPKAPLWLAANRASEGDEWGLAESRTPSGERYLEVFSHPLEVLAMGRGDQPMPIRADQLASGMKGDDGLTGIVIDPAGPWIQLTRDDMAPIIDTLAEGE